MNREYHKWYSPSLGRDMELLLYGTSGRPVLAFPTSFGRFYQNEDFGLIGAVADKIDNGWLQIVCVDGIDLESWYNRSVSQGVRAARHAQYESYIINELLPFFRQRNDRVSYELNTVGASFGAYHALNFAFRHPDLVKRILAMSGAFSLSFLIHGDWDQGVYLNSPADYVPGLSDDWFLSRIKQQEIILTVGSDDISRGATEHMSRVLWDKGIWHNLDIWGGAWHDWPWWKLMVQKYL